FVPVAAGMRAFHVSGVQTCALPITPAAARPEGRAGMTRPAGQAARDRIATSFEEALFVEAGAGTGKTSSLVTRIVGLVGAGYEQIGRASCRDRAYVAEVGACLQRVR